MKQLINFKTESLPLVLKTVIAKLDIVTVKKFFFSFFSFFLVEQFANNVNIKYIKIFHVTVKQTSKTVDILTVLYT